MPTTVDRPSHSWSISSARSIWCESTPIELPTSASRAVLLLLRPPIARIRSTLSRSTSRRRACCRSLVGSQIVLQSRNSPPSGTTMPCNSIANFINSSTFLVVWLTSATFRGGVTTPGPLAPRFAFHGRPAIFLAAPDLCVRCSVVSLLGRAAFALAAPAEYRLHFGVVGIAVDDKVIALPDQLLGQ